MKKIVFLLSLLFFGYINAMEPEEEEKVATVQIIVGGEDVPIPLEDLSDEERDLLSEGLADYLGRTVIVNKKDLLIEAEKEEQEKRKKEAEEHLKQKKQKVQDLREKTLAFVHGWMAKQQSKTKRLQLLHEIETEQEKEIEKILKEQRKQLEKED